MKENTLYTSVFSCCEQLFITAYIIPMLLSINAQSRNGDMLRWKIALARYDLHGLGRLALRAQSRERL